MLKVAVITGGHGYDVPGFHALFRGLEGVDAYIQHMDDWSTHALETAMSYDTVVFYSMMQNLPASAEDGLAAAHRRAIDAWLASGKGFMVWHHALLVYSGWPLWDEIVGCSNRLGSAKGFDGEKVHVEIADANHPITRGLGAWDMVDETYTMNETDAASHALFTTTHAKSMHTLGWTRQHGAARVFCFQPGHDAVAWRNASLQEVLRRGIAWCAGQLI
jgi:uncharacterized protein